MTQSVLENEMLMEAEEQKPPRALLVCFVCTGNTCRSPMAEAVVNHLAAEEGRGTVAFSAGLYAYAGDPIAQNAVTALENAGISPHPDRDYHTHVAHTLGDEEAEGYDLLVGMGKSHVMELIMRYPRMARRILCMPTPIADPFGGDLAAYEACLAEITQGVKELLLLGEET